MSEYQVYVIENGEARRYIGVSADVARRLADHNDGLSTWTRNRGPWRLVWASRPMTLTEARKFENHLKRQGRGSGFYTLTGLQRPSGS